MYSIVHCTALRTCTPARSSRRSPRWCKPQGPGSPAHTGRQTIAYTQVGRQAGGRQAGDCTQRLAGRQAGRQWSKQAVGRAGSAQGRHLGGAMPRPACCDGCTAFADLQVLLPGAAQPHLGLHNGHQPVVLRNLRVASQGVSILQDGLRGGALALADLQHRAPPARGTGWGSGAREVAQQEGGWGLAGGSKRQEPPPQPKEQLQRTADKCSRTQAAGTRCCSLGKACALLVVGLAACAQVVQALGARLAVAAGQLLQAGRHRGRCGHARRTFGPATGRAGQAQLCAGPGAVEHTRHTTDERHSR